MKLVLILCIVSYIALVIYPAEAGGPKQKEMTGAERKALMAKGKERVNAHKEKNNKKRAEAKEKHKKAMERMTSEEKAEHKEKVLEKFAKRLFNFPEKAKAKLESKLPDKLKAMLDSSKSEADLKTDLEGLSVEERKKLRSMMAKSGVSPEREAGKAEGMVREMLRRLATLSEEQKAELKAKLPEKSRQLLDDKLSLEEKRKVVRGLTRDERKELHSAMVKAGIGPNGGKGKMAERLAGLSDEKRKELASKVPEKVRPLLDPSLPPEKRKTIVESLTTEEKQKFHTTMEEAGLAPERDTQIMEGDKLLAEAELRSGSTLTDAKQATYNAAAKTSYTRN